MLQTLSHTYLRYLVLSYWIVGGKQSDKSKLVVHACQPCTVVLVVCVKMCMFNLAADINGLCVSMQN